MALTKVSTGLISADLASVDLNIDANTLYIDVTNNRVGINNTGPATALDVTGTVTADGLTVDGNAIISTADNSAQLTLISTDTDALVGPQLNLWRNSGTGTNGDLIGQITFTGEDTAGSTNTFASIHAVADQADNGAEDGSLHFGTMINGSLADRLVIDSAGNVGIGTASPSASLHVNGNTVANTFKLIANTSVSGSDATIFRPADNTMAFSTNGTERMRIDSSGQVTVSGTGSTTYSTSKGVVVDYSTSSTSNVLPIGFSWSNSIGDTNPLWGMGFIPTNYGSGAADLGFYTSGTERMRIDSSGNLLVGTTSAFTDGSINSGGSGALHIARDNERCLFLKRASSNGTVVEFFRGSISSAVGSISIDSSSTAYNTSSDQRLKENIVDAPSASDDIDAIQVRSFDWKADGSHQKYGMVAQELVTVAPEAVSQPEDPEEMMGVDYSKLVPMMLKEIQSLRARVAQLEGAN